MMMRLFAILLGFLPTLALACPYCAGNGQAGKDSNTTLILALFILAIYIPYYLIYRMIKKHREIAKLKEAHDTLGSTNS